MAAKVSALRVAIVVIRMCPIVLAATDTQWCHEQPEKCQLNPGTGDYRRLKHIVGQGPLRRYPT